MECAFTQGIREAGLSTINGRPLLYYRKNTLLAVYIDDCILAVKEEQALKKVIEEIVKEFEITDEGDVDEYLGVEI